MPKRRIDDDEAPQPSTSANKRARFDHRGPIVNEFEVEEEAQPSSRARGKRRQRDEDEANDDDDIEMVPPENQPVDAQEEAQFEEEHQEAIRESIRQRQNMRGGVAKFGIIEAVEMHQFMCHKYLTFKFGPQINFIIGHNGSGKSAVLSAITVALGGKATSTGRGSGLKSFIREGQQVAEVSLTLKNQGEEAYRHELYGDSIVVTRRFTKDGSSSYKIKSKDGRVVSSKREELAAICDHMNIQVDNPMTVLTQDAARQFLSTSHAADKYKFFLRGTQLSQLSEEYQTCMDNVQRMHAIIGTKRGALEDLRAAWEDASARYAEASKARDLRHKADELKKELAWSHVASKEAELQKKVQNSQRAQARLPEIQDRLAAATTDFEAASEVVTTREEEHAAIGNVDNLYEQERKYKDDIKERKAQIQKLRNDEREINDAVRSSRTVMERLENEITAAQAKAAENSEGRHDQLVARLEEAKQALERAEADLHEAEAAHPAKVHAAEAAKKRGEAIERERNEARAAVEQNSAQLAALSSQRGDSLAAFGKGMDAVLRRIRETRWHGNVPVGPFGKFVKVRDPRRWAEIMRIQIGNLMSGFAVSDTRDTQALRKILKDHGNHNSSIVVAEVDLFDYSSGELPEQYLTMLRALDISDEYVKRILINQARIEKTMLAETRREGDDALRGLRGGGTCLTGDLYRVTRFSDGGGSSNPLNAIRPGEARGLLFTGRDTAAELEHLRGKVQEAERRLQVAEGQLQEAHGEYRRLAQEADQARVHVRTLGRARDEAKLKRNSLTNEVNLSVPAEVEPLQALLAEEQNTLQKYLDQFQDISPRKAALDAENKTLLAEQQKIRGQITEFDAIRQQALARVEEAVHDRVKAQTAQQHWTQKLKTEQDKVQRAKDDEDVTREEFSNWTAKAEEFCARVETRRPVERVQRELDAVQNSLKAREKRDGASIEDMVVEVNRTKAALEKTKAELQSMDMLVKSLKNSLQVRMRKWIDFRRHIAFRCRVTFQFHLSNRGYFGKVTFDHVNHTLDLKVQTDDVNATQNEPQGARDKDPRSLSGGEKSFSTICLLLAMWEAIGSPIRCLDEFDVFMDAVNRRISAKMIIDTANSSDGKQYVLITPNSMDNIHIGSTVRVHRMRDPERGQGTLASGSTVA